MLLIASTLLLLATIAMWIRSYWAVDAFSVRRWHEYTIESAGGGITVARTSSLWKIGQNVQSVPLAPRWEIAHRDYSVTPNILSPTNNGSMFCLEHETPWWFSHRPSMTAGWLLMGGGMLGDSVETWRVPFWPLLVLFGFLPVTALVRHLRRKGRETGDLCPTCGYDLRASPDRCPECGQARQPISSPA